MAFAILSEPLFLITKNRREQDYLLMVSPHHLLAMEPIVISDSDDVTPSAYRRLKEWAISSSSL